jgi:hypothetical protein
MEQNRIRASEVETTEGSHYIQRQGNSNLKTVNVKLSLCLTKHHTVKTYDGVLIQLHAFLTLVLDGSEWLASGPDRSTPDTHYKGGWVGPRNGLNPMTKRKIPYLSLPGIVPWSSSP